MFRFNRYILLFLIVCAVVIGALWKVVQSERFANFAVERISESFLEKENIKFDVERVEISVFPPATNFKNAELTYVADGSDLRVESRDASIEFSFINLLSSDFVIDRIYLADSVISLSSKKRREADESSEIDVDTVTKDLRGIIQQVHRTLPFNLNSAQLHQVTLVKDNDRLDISDAQLRLYNNYLIGDISLENFEISSLEDLRDDLREFDSASLSLELADNYVNLTDIKLRRQLDLISGSVNYRFDNGQLQGEADYAGGMSWPLKILKEHKQIDVDGRGYINASLSTQGPIENLKFDLDTSVQDVKSKDFIADSVKVAATYMNERLELKSFQVEHNQGLARLVEKVEIYSEANGLTQNKIPVLAQNLSTQTAFYPIREQLGIVGGRLSGLVNIRWPGTDTDLEFSIPERLKVEGFVLGDDPKKPILKNQEIILDQTKVTVDKGNGVLVDSRISFGSSSFVAKGRISNDEVAFVTSDEQIDFEELGPIAGVQLIGKGDVGLKVYGPVKDVMFDIDLNTKDSVILGYHLGKIEADLSLSLSQDRLEIRALSGQYLDSSYEGHGAFTFTPGSSNFELDLQTSKVSYNDSQKLLAPLFDELPYVPEELSFLAVGEFNVKGDLENNKVKVNGPISMNYIDYYGEVFDSAKADILFDKGALSLKNIVLQKGEGKLEGSFLYNTVTEFLEYDAKWKNIRPSDFKLYRQLDLGLETFANLDVYGSGTLNDFTSRTKITTSNSRVLGQKYEESELTIFGQSGIYDIQGDIFDKGVDLSARLDFTGSQGKTSEVALKIDLNNLKEIFALVSSHNIQSDQLEGKAKGELKSRFNIDKLDRLDLNIEFDEFEFNYKGLSLKPRQQLKLSLDEGRVEESNLDLRSSGDYITPSLAGSLKEGFTFDLEYMLPVFVFELLTPEVQFSSGRMSGIFSVGKKVKYLETYAELNMQDVGMQTTFFPGNLRDGRLRAVLDNRTINIETFNASYGKGSVNGSGEVLLEFPFPTLNLKGQVSDAFIPFMSRSGIVTSSNFSLTGESLPYILNGEITILFAEVLEDIDEFRKQQASSTSYQRFLPKSEGRARELIELNLGVNVQRPIQVRNSLLELNIDGQAQIKGPLSLPKPSGRFQIVPSSSKFKFKGHEFNLTKGSIILGDEFNREGAILDFSGVTQINEYRVRLDVSGRTKNVDVSLSSEPGLSQEDLFSLLTLGVTSEVSTELDENERQSVATVGIGALLADQLKLNEGLDSSFGLRLSVLPEYAEESDALLQGKSAVSDSGTNRFRSSTKVRVQKKINDRVDLSVSSTVGGSLEQRQEMNVNYKISNDWSLEGVYELKSTDDEGIESSDSIGADLKYRWSF